MSERKCEMCGKDCNQDTTLLRLCGDCYSGKFTEIRARLIEFGGMIPVWFINFEPTNKGVVGVVNLGDDRRTSYLHGGNILVAMQEVYDLIHAVNVVRLREADARSKALCATFERPYHPLRA